MIDPNAPAFPGPCTPPDPRSGLTIRAYFAAESMKALMSCDRWIEGLDQAAEKNEVLFKNALAHESVKMADALIAALNADGGGR